MNLTPVYINSAASTNGQTLFAGSRIVSLAVSNTGAGAAYLKLYNKASAPTVGTDAPVLTIAVGANATVTVPMPAEGMPFTLGIGLAITGAAADSDTTAVGAGEVKVMACLT